MAKNQKKHTEGVDEFEEVGKALWSAEAFVEKHSSKLLYVLIAALVIVGGVLWYNKHIKELDVDAQSSLYESEQLFAQDSLRLALGGGDTYGFISISDNYGGTPSANLANAYAGICYMRLGEYDNGIKYLKKFDGEDVLVTPSIIGDIGDCYLDKGDFSEAESYYSKAASHENDVTAPFYLRKKGIALEAQNKFADAVKVYAEIKTKYPSSREAAGIEGDLTRAQVKLQK